MPHLFQSSIELTLSKPHFHGAIMEAKPRDRMGIGMITSDRDSDLGGSPTQHQLYIHTGAVHSYCVVDTRTASKLRITIIVHTLPILKFRRCDLTTNNVLLAVRSY